MYWYRGQRDKSGRVLSEASCNREASRGMEETCRADSLGLHATRFFTRRLFPARWITFLENVCHQRWVDRRGVSLVVPRSTG